MEFIKKLEFGNYTLKFGDNFVLLDFLDEIVMPSFYEMNYVRSIKNRSDYFFINTEMVILDDSEEHPVIGIQGRIVKNTVLSRDQIISGNEIIEDYDELETAPSSIFLLILNTHRLILCKEVSGAPSVENFRSTSQYCLTQRWNDYIDEIYKEEKEFRKNSDLPRLTKKSLREDIPTPKLRITTLTDKKSLEDFIELFEKINRVSIKLLPTNQEEIDNDDFFWQEFGEIREQMNSQQASVLFTNPEDGLRHNAVLEQLESSSSLANSEFTLKGFDEAGDIMKGNNDNFSLTCEVKNLSKDINEAIPECYKEFEGLVADERIRLPKISEKGSLGKIKRIFNRFG
ncbi:hypothetical protein LJQ72_05960 [Pectobacterium brasiliense]|uniref:hypothetical protein n=1 Tax=Pectobacterium brasiliense TaxID=180957 RepID=UPI001D0D22D7|nr:hypothetical protein [Pectobacterium brasiliense]UDQ77111.1 hypothetical protein LJQ72_05960 [Pectobacterium brasiliense]